MGHMKFALLIKRKKGRSLDTSESIEKYKIVDFHQTTFQSLTVILSTSYFMTGFQLNTFTRFFMSIPLVFMETIALSFSLYFIGSPIV